MIDVHTGKRAGGRQRREEYDHFAPQLQRGTKVESEDELAAAAATLAQPSRANVAVAAAPEARAPPRKKARTSQGTGDGAVQFLGPSQMEWDALPPPAADGWAFQLEQCTAKFPELPRDQLEFPETKGVHGLPVFPRHLSMEERILRAVRWKPGCDTRELQHMTRTASGQVKHMYNVFNGLQEKFGAVKWTVGSLPDSWTPPGPCLTSRTPTPPSLSCRRAAARACRASGATSRAT